MKNANKILQSISYLTILGNVLFLLWITYNAIKEGFSGTLPQKISYFGLLGLLSTNIYLILEFLKGYRK